MKIDLVVTRHAPLVALLIERGTITTETPVLEHASANDITGKHVLGVLPHHLSSKCASITEVPMALTPSDREAMTRGDLSLDRTREVAGEPVTYTVRAGEPNYTHEMAECHRLALAHAACWSWPPNVACGQGVVEYVGSEGLDVGQVDIYSKGRPRYRTASMDDWSPWMLCDGTASSDQRDPCALGRLTWLDSAVDRVGSARPGPVEIWETRRTVSDSPTVVHLGTRIEDGRREVREGKYWRWIECTTRCKPIMETAPAGELSMVGRFMEATDKPKPTKIPLPTPRELLASMEAAGLPRIAGGAALMSVTLACEEIERVHGIQVDAGLVAVAVVARLVLQAELDDGEDLEHAVKLALAMIDA